MPRPRHACRARAADPWEILARSPALRPTAAYVSARPAPALPAEGPRRRPHDPRGLSLAERRPMIRLWILGGVVASAVSACATEPDDQPHLATPLALSQLTDLRLDITSDLQAIHIVLGYHSTLGCAALDAAAAATLNGVAMTIESRGYISYPINCLKPVFALTTPPFPTSAQLRLLDPEEVASCDLGDALALPPPPTLTPDGPWQFTRGSTVTLRWPAAGQANAVRATVDVGFGAVTADTSVDAASGLTTLKIPVVVGSGSLLLYPPRRELTCANGLPVSVSPAPWRQAIEVL